MSELGAKARAYWTTVVIGGASVLTVACVWLAPSLAHLTVRQAISLGTFAVLALGAELMSVPLTTFDDESARHSIGSVAAVAAIVVLPWYAAVVVAGAAVAISGLDSLPLKSIFNTANTALTVAAGATMFALMGGDAALTGPGLSGGLHALTTMVALAATYQVSMSAIVAIMVGLASAQRPLQVLRTLHLKTSLQETTTIGLGLMLGGFWLYNPAFAPLVALPVVMAYFSIETFVGIQQETRQAVLEMARSIDLRDPATRQHSQRVAKLSVALAQQLDLSHEQVANIELSSLVHDIGKIGIPNEILNKPGKLTDEERGQMEAHPVIGYEMLRHYKQFRNGLDIVRSHHERWDGTGYPDRIPSAQLPLETRIVCVADAYEAMTADRPYRSAMSSRVAYARLEEAAGTQFDPQLVPLFYTALIQCGEAAPADLEPELPALVHLSETPGPALPAPAHVIRPLYRPRVHSLRRISTVGRCHPDALAARADGERRAG
jgi:putative nucleotidyltransferase with HDIG domain